MKRCPDCEFIYEEHQSFCDMDGHTLVHDQQLSVRPTQVAAPTKSAKTSSLSGIALPVSAGLLLATLFSVGYYSSSGSVAANIEPPADESVTTSDNQASATQALIPTDQLIAIAYGEQEQPSPADSEPKAVSPLEPNQSPNPAHAHFAAPANVPVVRGIPPLPRLRPLPRLPEATALAKKSDSGRIVGTILNAKPQKENHQVSPPVKKESRVGSFIKKTGRVLTKPFRL